MAMAPPSPAVEDQVRLLPENLHTKKQEHGNRQPLAVPLACPKGAQQNPNEKTATGGKPPTAATTGARKMSLHLELSLVDVGSTHTFAAGRGRHRHGLAGNAEGRIPLVVIKPLGPRDAAAEAAAHRPDPATGSRAAATGGHHLPLAVPEQPPSLFTKLDLEKEGKKEGKTWSSSPPPFLRPPGFRQPSQAAARQGRGRGARPAAARAGEGDERTELY